METKRGTINHTEFARRFRELVEEYNGDYPDNYLILAGKDDAKGFCAVADGRSERLVTMVSSWMYARDDMFHTFDFAVKLAKKGRRQMSIRSFLGKLISPFIRFE